jgi:hypothetical protein
LKEASVAGRTVTLKLKTVACERAPTRLTDPTRLAETLFRTAAACSRAKPTASPGFGLSGRADTLVDSPAADPPTLFDQPRRLEHAMDQIRAGHGEPSARLDRGLPRAGNTSHRTILRRREG